MDKKKLKLSISGNTKKTINNIEQARSNPKNSVIIKNNRSFSKKNILSLHLQKILVNRRKIKVLKKLLRTSFLKKIYLILRKENLQNKGQQKG